MQHGKMFYQFWVFHFVFSSSLKLELRAGKGEAGGEREDRDPSFLGLPFQKRDTDTAILGTT